MRFFNGCFILVFVLMMALPLIFVDLSSDRISVTENRMLANRPFLSEIKSSPGTFIRQFDDWFKDSTGFREKLLVIYKSVNDNKWLNNVVRYTDGQYVYLIGEKGHHYFAYNDGGWMILKFQGKQILSDEQLANMTDKFKMVKTFLDNKGIPLVVMFCTDKESVYPEYYPKSIKRGPEPILLDHITGYLQERTNVDVFNIRKALLAEKDNNLLYNVSSGDLTHYNQIGAFFAYRELMKHITKYFPDIVPYELNDIDINYYEKGIPSVSLKTEITYKRAAPSFFGKIKLNSPIAFENTRHNLPVILFLSDSYADEQYIGKYFAQHFGKAIFIPYSDNMEYFEEIIIRYKPNIVVFESAERQLFGFYVNIIQIPELP